MLALAGCGGKHPDPSSEDGEAAARAEAAKLRNPLELAKSDVADLDRWEGGGATEVDAKYSGAFTAIFGGTDAVHVRDFFEQRIHHLVDPKKTGASPNQFANEGWLTDAAPGGTPSLSSLSPFAQTPAGYEVGAVNIGTLLWLKGLINNVSVSVIQQDGPSFPITSSRTGVIYFGAGYKATEKARSGAVIKLPEAYRQSILLHEARHSDCTGGITETQLRKIRTMHDSAEMARSFEAMPCGHLHSICKTGDLAGIAACDIEPWGAYTVGSIYALAALVNAKTDLDRAILRGQFVDQIKRLQVDTDALLHGRLGRPDMSNQGYRDDTTAAPPVPNGGSAPQ